jgi:hypothetical protein
MPLVQTVGRTLLGCKHDLDIAIGVLEEFAIRAPSVKPMQGCKWEI